MQNVFTLPRLQQSLALDKCFLSRNLRSHAMPPTYCSCQIVQVIKCNENNVLQLLYFFMFNMLVID